MTWDQLIGIVIMGLVVLYISCRIIFTAWHITREIHSTDKREGKQNGST